MEQPALEHHDHCVSDDVCSADNHDRGATIDDNDINVILEHYQRAVDNCRANHDLVKRGNYYLCPHCFFYFHIDGTVLGGSDDFIDEGSDHDGRGESHTGSLDHK